MIKKKKSKIRTVRIPGLSRILKRIEEEKKLPMPEIEEVNNDFVLGLLVGEIIWYKLLGRYTHYTLEETMATKEEVAEQERLSDIWYKKSGEIKLEAVRLARGKKGKNLTSTERYSAEMLADKGSNTEWYAYNDYSHSLIVKYFPLELEFSDMICWCPKDMEKFYEGVESYLWNTDECCYNFKPEDITLDNHRGRNYLQWRLKIEFRLDEIHLMPRKDYDEMLKKRSEEKKRAYSITE